MPRGAHPVRLAGHAGRREPHPRGDPIRALILAPALPALALAWWTGAHWIALALAAAAWIAAWPTRGIPQLLLLLVAPVAATATIPSAGLDASLLGAALVAALGALPLLRALGPAWPRPRAYVVALGAVAVLVAFALTPPGAVLMASDLAGGAVVVALAAGTVAWSRLPA